MIILGLFMNKHELVSAMAQTTKLTQKDVVQVLDAFIENVQNTLKNGGELTLLNFGTFKIRTRKAREGRHPKTGEPLQIPESRVPQFKAGKALRTIFS